MVEDATTGQPVGTVQATVDVRERSALIAYVLFCPSWGHGFAKASVKLLLATLVERFELQRVQAEIHEENERSIKVVKNLGFAHVDTVSEDGYNDLIFARTLDKASLSALAD